MLRHLHPPAVTMPEPQSAVWCRRYSGETYAFETFLEAVRRFHGHVAPGLVLGGKMVHVAMSGLPPGILYDALCETANCLPDAIQMLTPCTIGNGWLRVEPLGRFALALFDKSTGRGLRASLDAGRLEAWPEVAAWFFKLKGKADQDADLLMQQIRDAGDGIVRLQPIQVKPEILGKRSLGPRRICEGCGDSYPAKHGMVCRACQGCTPYRDGEAGPRSLKPIPMIRGRDPAAGDGDGRDPTR
jgi:formylmethanofuran dehydrogenase subunit E